MSRSIAYVCFHNGSGYAQAALDYIYALTRTNRFSIRMTTLHRDKKVASVSESRARLIRQLMDAPCDPDAIQILHCLPVLQRKVRRLKRTVGFATFESMAPPQKWVSVLNTNDAVIVPSKFNERVFRDSGVERPIFHIPHCIDNSLYNPAVMPLKNTRPDVFRFLFFGSWSKRKGWEQLLEAYWREFSANEKVCLTIKTNNAVQCKRDVCVLRGKLGLSEKDVAPVLLENTVFDEQRLPRFLKSHDCLVFPTFGEGFGLPPLQCMALGVPVICTNYSGCQDYLSGDTATLLEPEGLRVYQMLDNISQFRNQTWAFVPVDRIREAMRTVYSNVDEAKSKAARGAELVANDFGYPAAVARFETLFNYFGVD